MAALALVSIMLNIAAVAYCMTLFHRMNRQDKALERYRVMVLEWTMYLHDKKAGQDFALWRKELSE
jgi:hypothetical protein